MTATPPKMTPREARVEVRHMREAARQILATPQAAARALQAIQRASSASPVIALQTAAHRKQPARQI